MLFSIGKKERALFVLVVQWPPLKYNNPILAQKKSCSYLETTHPAFHIKVHNNTIAITTKYIEKKEEKKREIFFLTPELCIYILTLKMSFLLSFSLQNSSHLHQSC